VSRRRGRYSRDDGYVFARAHIEAGQQLSRELGGTDKDVKDYFFGLPDRDLKIILDLYEHHHGSKAREYASATIKKWKSGRVKMGGQTASRLFNLLPPLMPPQSKYQLIENLWKHFGPSSKKILRIGLDADVTQILDVVRQHIEDVVVHYKIPDNLERRFEWLSAGDTHVKQELLNRLRAMEKSLVVEGARVQLPVMLEHLRSEQGKDTHRLAQVLIVGKHELELSLEKDFSGVALVDPPTRRAASYSSGSDTSWWSALGWLLVAAVVLFLMFRK
jgi:hypothetical protein